MRQLSIEVSGSNDVGPCDCCGSKSRTVWGFVHRGDATEAAYDAVGRPEASSELAGKPLAREEVIGTPLATQAFELVDAVWLHDKRIAEIVEGMA